MHNHILSPDDARKLYDDGCRLAFSTIPEFTHSSQDRILQRLTALKQFRRNNVIWAKLDEDRIVALETATRLIACMAIIPDGHDLLESQSSVFSAGRHGDVRMLTILPCPFTREWAGIGLVKSLSHLYDMDPNAESRTENRRNYLEAEVRAYDCELTIIENLTDGRFSAAIAELISDLKVHDLNRYVQVVNTGSKLSCIAKKLDPLVSSDPPASHWEAGLRLGVYILALGFHVAQSCGTDAISPDEWKKRIVYAVMESHPEHSKHIPK